MHYSILPFFVIIVIKGLAWIFCVFFGQTWQQSIAFEFSLRVPIVLKLGTHILHVLVHVHLEFQPPTRSGSRATRVWILVTRMCYFPLWFECVRLGAWISNRDISAVCSPTVLRFGEQLHEWFLFMPSEFHAIRISRFRDVNRASRQFQALSAYSAVPTSFFNISASTGPISPRFREDVPLDVLYRYSAFHLDKSSRSSAASHDLAAC